MNIKTFLKTNYYLRYNQIKKLENSTEEAKQTNECNIDLDNVNMSDTSIRTECENNHRTNFWCEHNHKYRKNYGEFCIVNDITDKDYKKNAIKAIFGRKI